MTAADESRAKHVHTGLSPSSLQLFQSCPRKYYYKKIAKLPIDPDSSEDTEALLVGKAFHKCLEETRHNLDGFTYEATKKIICGEEFKLDEEKHLPMIFAMLGKYKSMHKKSGCKALAFEVPIETESFYGIVDVILEDPTGGLWIGDMKTASSYTPNLVPQLMRNQQLNLYAAHVEPLFDKLGLDVGNFKGCRYRLTTKSKLIKQKKETVQNYIVRMMSGIVSVDFLLPKAILDPTEALVNQLDAFRTTSSEKDIDYYDSNYQTCFQWYRPCEFFSRCHGHLFSKPPDIVVVEG